MGANSRLGAYSNKYGIYFDDAVVVPIVHLTVAGANEAEVDLVLIQTLSSFIV